MPRLILLNGPPGIGKSTIAQMYVDEHPGVLNLDIDRLTQLIGGWRSQRKRILPLGRTDALAMGAAHLRSGCDVIVPQLVGRLSELERFEGVARDAGVAFCHIVLMDGKANSAERFDRRGGDSQDPWLRELHAHVDRLGRAELLSRIYEDLSDVVRSRLTSILVTSEEGAIEQTYSVVADALAQGIPPTPPRGVAVVLDAQRILVIKRRRKGIEYAVLPGGGVGAGESSADAAVRELREETSLAARIGSELWHRVDDGREATYFLMTDVRGTRSSPATSLPSTTRTTASCWSGRPRTSSTIWSCSRRRSDLRCQLSFAPPARHPMTQAPAVSARGMSTDGVGSYDVMGSPAMNQLRHPASPTISTAGRSDVSQCDRSSRSRGISEATSPRR